MNTQKETLIIDEISAEVAKLNDSFPAKVVKSGLQHNVHLTLHNLAIGYQLLYKISGNWPEEHQVKEKIEEAILNKAATYPDMIVSTKEL